MISCLFVLVALASIDQCTWELMWLKHYHQRFLLRADNFDKFAHLRFWCSESCINICKSRKCRRVQKSAKYEFYHFMFCRALFDSLPLDYRGAFEHYHQTKHYNHCQPPVANFDKFSTGSCFFQLCAQCTVHSAQCTQCTAQCTVHTAQCTVHNCTVLTYQKFSQLVTIDFTGIPYYHCSLFSKYD